MAAQSPFSFIELFRDADQQQQREAIERRRDFANLVPFWFDEFQDFYHSDSEQSADTRPLPPHFTVDYSSVDADGFSDASDLVDNVVLDDDGGGGGGVFDGFDHENQVNFVRNMFQDRVEDQERRMSGSDFGVVDESNYLDFDLGMEFGLGLNFGEVEENGEFMVGDDDDDDDDAFFGSWRMDGGEPVRVFRNRLGSEEQANPGRDGSDLYSEEEDEFGLEHGNTIDDASETLCWDSLHLEDDEDRIGIDDEEVEWEEVADGGVEELQRDILSVALSGEVDDDVVESVLQLQNDEVVPERVVTGWEVLLNAENVRGEYLEPGNEDMYFGPEGYFYADEYETVFGQFADNESGAMGKPPAAKSSMENLETVVVTQVDVESNTSLCAVCKDDMRVGEKAKRLPCSHCYHGDCIIPWLAIRNTCPVCRFELPTDDPDYERRRTQRASSVN